MSIRAYLVKKDTKIIDDKEYVHEEHEYLWNIWHEPEIWDILWPIMVDYTNDDCCGHIEIMYDAWEDFKEYCSLDSENSKNIRQVIDEYKEVFKKIDDALKDDDYVKITLY